MIAMRLVVTGSDGFVGENLCVRLRELGYGEVFELPRSAPMHEVVPALIAADFVFHLAGIITAPERPGHGLAFRPEILLDCVVGK